MMGLIQLADAVMTMTATGYKHIFIDERQAPMIEGSTLKVIELVMAQQAYGWTPEEIQINHRNLSMGQIHGALAYYWDHKSELDKAIELNEYFLNRRTQPCP
jgi:uncharacterized protein (DUF433 family)